MKLRLLLCFLFISTLFAEESKLKTEDIAGVMNQFFAYHVDQNEISARVLERSLKIYLNHFDPTHSYLLQEEVIAYTQPSGQLLQAALKEYEQERFTTYFTLNEVIKRGINRARGWRQSWESDPKALVAAAISVEGISEKKPGYPHTYAALRDRHYDRFVRYLAYQMEMLAYPSYEGREGQLVTLCERQLTLLENSYLGIDEGGYEITGVDEEHLVVLRTLKALAQSLDAHTAYYSPEEAYAMKVQLERGMCGIGVLLREGIDGITVQEVIEGGPAKESGLIEVGDTIVQVDGVPIQDISFKTVLEIMRGSEGSATQLGILRNNQFLQVELVRRAITLGDKRVDVRSEPFGEGIIGTITLHSFYEGKDGVSSENDLKEAIDSLRARGSLRGLVLDMRENSGGFLTQAVKVSGLFISSGVVVISRYSDGSIKYYRNLDGERYYEGPLVVLVSRGSASATEIVAQTLQDYGVAVVVGDERTYGKGTIQHQTVTQDKTDSFFKVTVGRYYTVSGKSTQISGVKSDILVPSIYHFEELGEAYLDYPLPADSVEAAYHDNLQDIDPFARRWFKKYYVPTLQPVVESWQPLIPQLAINSERRIAQNQNYQQFLEAMASDKRQGDFGENDLQIEESVNIVKDMILLSNEH